MPKHRTPLKLGKALAPLIAAAALCVSSAKAAPLCAGIFSASIDKSIQQLAKFRFDLDMAQGQGKSSIELTALNANYVAKEKDLAQHLQEQKIMSHDELIQKIIAEILQLQNESKKEIAKKREAEERLEKERQAIVDKDQESYQTKAIFHSIPAGNFVKPLLGMQAVELTIAESFDLMATPTTQHIWRKVALLANAEFGFKINPDPSQYKGENMPVESVSYIQVQAWIDALNELSLKGYALISELIPDHRSGDVYHLPTSNEWQYVFRDLGALKDLEAYGNDESALGDYAWSRNNSGSTLHPVATKKPLLVNGRKFYDMMGNIKQWTSEINPDGLRTRDEYPDKFRIVHGSSFAEDATVVDHVNHPNSGNNLLGFRLIREARR